jgi:hypothetical protein
MIIISTKEDKKIPYHDKVIESYTTLINSIDKSLLLTNPIISGSNAIKYIYSPKSECNDIDLYFTSEENYLLAKEMLLKKFKNIYESENALSFNDIKVQLIKKDFKNPEDIILSHDLFNVACAITSDKIYTTQKTHYAWYSEEIVLQNFQLSENPTNEERLLKLSILVQRIIKYRDRYNLSLSNSLKKFLYENVEFLKSNPNLTLNKTLEEIVLDYYGRPIIHYSFTSKSTLFLIVNDLLKDFNLLNYFWEVNQSEWIS